ncbi:lipocalin family protein [Aquimarina sp. 2201CG1-2-11]|uniref:lipocalin family protein n=1 Tax=Aquimarina discodermiae TaxID=3231043 RepID=UPI003461AEC8
MENIRILWALLLAVTLVTSCKKDDDQTDQMDQTDEIGNSFTFEDTTYDITYAVVKDFDNHIQLTLANVDFYGGNYTGELDFVGILFNATEVLPEGTFSFKNDTDPDYDSTLHFFDSEAGAGLQMANGEADTSSNYYENIDSGTVTIEKSEDEYTIEFKLIFDKGTFDGSYTGKIENKITKVEDKIVGRWKLVEYFENDESFTANECEQKSIVEFREDNTFTDIAVIDDEMDSSLCIYDGFGISGKYTVESDVLTTITEEVVAIPEDLNDPSFIEEAKGENEPQTISFEENKLTLFESIQDGDQILTFKLIYEKTTDEFFEE